MLTLSKLPARIREARHESGMSLAQLGLRIGTNRQTVSKYELGKLTPSLQIFVNLCNELDQSPENLLK